jgi:transcriptional regulator with XRE-family HTH domain
MLYSVFRTLGQGLFRSGYPENPASPGECLRKIRFDLRLQIKHTAGQVGLNENTIIGWESRGVKPKKQKLLKLLQFYLQKGANPASLSACESQLLCDAH